MKKIIRSHKSVIYCRLAVVRDAKKKARETKDASEARYWNRLADAFMDDAARHAVANLAGPECTITA